MTEQEAIAKIHSVYPSGKKNGLSNMRALMEKLGRAQDGLFMVHIAGTNGKGSTCAMLERMLREAGYRTGLYSSPYIEVYNERIRIDGAPIEGGKLAALVEAVWPAVEACERENIHVTEFELGTALAFCAFAQEKVDVAIIEVGLGGRLDPTNIIAPQVCAIAPVGMDHMDYLGGTIEEIALEKAGIIKHNVPLSLGRQEATAHGVLVAAAKELAAPVIELAAENIVEEKARVTFDVTMGSERIDGLTVALSGRHQAENACTALGVVQALRQTGMKIPTQAIREGLLRVRWPGRLEHFGSVILDGAHNEHGVRALCAYADAWLDPEKTVLLTGMMADKETAKMAAMLGKRVRHVVCTKPNVPRAMDAQALAETFEAQGVIALVSGNPKHALARARYIAGEVGTVLCAGSLYLIGEIRTLLRQEKEFADVI